ncbi:MAG TPA: polyribonucleotide nucleotidyltransferase [Acidimicrobiia bacterium]
MSENTVRGMVGGKELSFSTGKLALQADGAVVATLGGTTMLVTAVANPTMREGIDFFPLTVDFEERMYAAGKIPGSFFRREGRPTEQAILAARLIDRPLRPSFEDGFRCETQVVVTSLSVDGENPFDVIALNGASAALAVSPIPFHGPIGAVRMAYKKGEWLPFPTEADLDESVFELVVAGRRSGDGDIDIMMVEAGATPEGLRLIAAGDAPSDEAAVTAGLEAAKECIAASIALQEELAASVQKPVKEWPLAVDYSPEILSRVEAAAQPNLDAIVQASDKAGRSAAESAAWEAAIAGAALTEEELDQGKRAFKHTLKEFMRARVANEGIRLDGRGPRDIRPISVEVGVVARTHGSGLFQRGETQVLNITTLGMLKMGQMLDNLSNDETKRYMHHYNMPPFSTGEAGFMRGPKRREIGHGALAEKAVLPAIPTESEFPYALRLVSEVLSSNGSTSMASVCASSLSLMDAGVPIAAPIAGIAMGLISHEGKYVTLTDILGAEDALGDMDFKVAGTADVITALQLDTKLQGLPSSVLAEALDQAKEARLHILAKMAEVISGPRTELNPWAPRIESIQIPKDKIGEVIGPKGKVVRELEEQTGATIEIEEEAGYGIVRVASADGEALAKAKERIMQIVYPPEPELGKEYEGEVVNITKFGAFVNILPGRDGLLHISKLDSSRRVERVEDYLTLGDKIQVVLTEIDRNGKLSLSMAGAEAPAPSQTPSVPREDGPRRRDNDRDRDRGGDRSPAPERQPEPAGDRRRAAVSFEDSFEELNKP